jgi:hypothetical protein
MLHYYAIIDLLLLAGYYGPLDWLGWVVNDCNDTNLLVASLLLVVGAREGNREGRKVETGGPLPNIPSTPTSSSPRSPRDEDDAEQRRPTYHLLPLSLDDDMLVKERSAVYISCLL